MRSANETHAGLFTLGNVF